MKHIKIVLFSLAVMILFCAKGHATTYFLKTPFGWNLLVARLYEGKRQPWQHRSRQRPF